MLLLLLLFTSFGRSAWCSLLEPPIGFEWSGLGHFILRDRVYELSGTDGLKEKFWLDGVLQAPTFVKAHTWSERNFLLLFFPSGVFSVYLTSEDTTKMLLYQTESAPAPCTDALLFDTPSGLYLAVSTSTESATSPTLLYKWFGEHFGEIGRVLTAGAKLMTLLKVDEGKQAVIVIGQNPANRTKAGTLVFALNGDSLRRIQFLPSDGPFYMGAFGLYFEQYLLIANRHSDNVLYWWDGDDFVEWLRFERFNKTLHLTMVYHNRQPILIDVGSESLSLYEMRTKAVVYMGKVSLKKPISKVFGTFLGRIAGRSALFLTALSDAERSAEILVVEASQLFGFKGPSDPLADCLDDLMESLSTRSEIIRSLKEQSEKLLLVDEAMEYTGHIVAHSALTLNNLKLAGGYREDAESFGIAIEELMSEAVALKGLLAGIDGALMAKNVIIKGNLHVDNLMVPRVKAESINGFKWEPSSWLSLSLPQNVKGPSFVKHLYTDRAYYANLPGFLKTSGDQVLDGEFHLESLTANNLIVSAINGHEFKDIALSSDIAPIFGRKVVDGLEVGRLQAELINQRSVEAFLDGLPDSTFSDVSFDYINGLDWRLVADVSSKGIEDGGLSFLDSATVVNLECGTVSGAPVSHFLTTSTDQVVNSEIKLVNVHAADVLTDLVNGISFEEGTLATLTNAMVYGPVSIRKLIILGDFEIDHEPGDDIEGTHEADLLQIYLGKVTISGSLRVQNLDFRSNAVATIDGEEFNSDTTKSYWLKSVPQTIPVDELFLHNLTVLHLRSEKINGVPPEAFLLNEPGEKRLSGAEFLNVEIRGNVSSGNRFLEDLASGTIPTNSNKTYIVSGRKTFKRRLTIDQLKTDSLAGISPEDVLSVRNLKGVKSFAELQVSGPVEAGVATVEKLEGFVLNKLLDWALRIDKPGKIKLFSSETLAASEIQAQTIHGQVVGSSLENLQDVYSRGMAHRIHVNGPLDLAEVTIADALNDLHVRTFLEKVVPKDLKEIFMNGSIVARGDVYAEDLVVGKMCGIELDYLLDSWLTRSGEQTLEGVFNVKQLKAGSLQTQMINDLLVSDLVTTNHPEEALRYNFEELYMKSATFSSLQVRTANCDFYKVHRSLSHPPTALWDVVDVFDSIVLEEDSSLLAMVAGKAVRSDVPYENLEVTGKVIFEGGLVSSHLRTENLINNISLGNIFADAVLKNADYQEIHGAITFINLEADEASVNGSAFTTAINDLPLDAVPFSSPSSGESRLIEVKGRKTFKGGLTASHLVIPTVHNTSPESLVSLGNVFEVPRATFANLSIAEDLNTTFINGVNLTSLLRKRVLLRSKRPQVLAAEAVVFENVEVEGDFEVGWINDVAVEQVVTDEGLQVVSGGKKFMGDVSSLGDVEVGRINGFDLVKVYQDSVLLGDDQTFIGDAVFHGRTQLSADLNTEMINGIHVADIAGALDVKQHRDNGTMAKGILSKVNDCLAAVQDLPLVYLYLDVHKTITNDNRHFSPARNILWHNTISESSISLFESSTCTSPANGCFCTRQRILSLGDLSEKYVEDIYMEFGQAEGFLYSNVSSCRRTRSVWDARTILVLGKGEERQQKLLLDSAGAVGSAWTPSKDLMVLTVGSRPRTKTLLVNLKAPGNVTQVLEGQKAIKSFTSNHGEALLAFGGSALTIHLKMDNHSTFSQIGSIPAVDPIAATGIALEDGTDSILLSQKGLPVNVYSTSVPEISGFKFYQSLQVDSDVLTVEAFHAEPGSKGNAFVAVATEDYNFFLFIFRHVEGWKLESRSQMEGLMGALPFHKGGKPFLYIPTNTPRSDVLAMAFQGGRMEV